MCVCATNVLVTACALARLLSVVLFFTFAYIHLQVLDVSGCYNIPENTIKAAALVRSST